MNLEEKIYIWSLVLKKSFLVELLLLIFSYLGEKAFPRKIIMNLGQNNVFLFFPISNVFLFFPIFLSVSTP